MRKIFAFILTACLLFTLSACNEEEPADNSIVILPDQETRYTVNGYKMESSLDETSSSDSSETVSAPSETTSPVDTSSEVTIVVTYVGNKNSKKLHYQSCRYASEMKDENKVTFDSLESALADGYTSCGVCKPK